MEQEVITGLDPKLAAALIGAMAAAVSAIVSYYVSRKTERTKGSVEYIRQKIAKLEVAKGDLIVFKNGSQALVTRENWINKKAEALRNAFEFSKRVLSEIEHYLDTDAVSVIQSRMKAVDVILLAAIAENQDIPHENEEKEENITGEEAVSEMRGIFLAVDELIVKELRQSTQKIEALIGLKRT